MFSDQFYEKWVSVKKGIENCSWNCSLHSYNRKSHLHNYNINSHVHNALQKIPPA